MAAHDTGFSNVPAIVRVKGAWMRDERGGFRLDVQLRIRRFVDGQRHDQVVAVAVMSEPRRSQDGQRGSKQAGVLSIVELVASRPEPGRRLEIPFPRRPVKEGGVTLRERAIEVPDRSLE